MKANYRVEITLNSDKTGSKESNEKILQWLQMVIPAIAKKQKLVVDEFFLAPLGHAVSISLN